MKKQKNIKKVAIATLIVFLFLIPSVVAVDNNPNVQYRDNYDVTVFIFGGFKNIYLIVINNGDETTDGNYEVSISSSVPGKGNYVNESFSVSAGKSTFIPIGIDWYVHAKAWVHLTADGVLPGVGIACGFVFVGFVVLPRRGLIQGSGVQVKK